MPAEIDTTTGMAAFVYNRMNGDPWHGAGIPASGAMTGDELFELCPALDFIVEKKPVLYANDDPNAAAVRSFPGWSVVIRTDTMAPLGIVRNSYSLFQNRELTTFADAVRGESGAAYDTAGSLFEGRVVFVQLILGDDFIIPGDPSAYQNRLLVWAGHDGRHALVAKRVKVRVVCANTLAIANGELSPTYSIRHTANMDVAIDDARSALKIVAAYDKTFEQAMTALTERRFGSSDIESFVETMFPVNPDTENPWRTERYRNEVRSLIEGSPTLDGVPMTAYRAYQALTEWADHYRTYRAKGASETDARAYALIGGSAQTVKDRAFRVLVAAK